MARGRGGFIGQDGLNAPDSPTSVSASAGDAQADVSFTAPTDVGGSAITGYRAQSNTGIGASGTSSPITVTGLTNGTSYTFNVWAINAFGYSAPSDASGSVSPVASADAINKMGDNTTSVDYININTTGNATDFGDAIATAGYRGALASSTRGVFGGGYSGTDGTINSIEYTTIAATGSFTDFGDLESAQYGLRALSNSTRGIFSGGDGNGVPINTLQYITIASVGNTTDFGDMTSGRYLGGNCSSSTRGLFGAGTTNFTSATAQNSIDYVTIASTGNGADFGDLTVGRYNPGSCSSSVRGVWGGGLNTSGVEINVIDYITIASTGNATDFGDLTVTGGSTTATSSSTRGLFITENTMDYITIASTGNATDFGDPTVNTANNAATSNAHGGLQ